MSKKQSTHVSPAMLKQTDHVIITDLQQKVEELTNNWKRALADYKNLEQRVERQRVETVMYATTALLVKLLDVLDDLERAMEHHPQEAWIGLIRDRLRGILTGEGISEIPTLDMPFDPATMECVEQSDGEKDKVTKVLVKGYKLHDQVVKVAKVKVGSGDKVENNE